MTNDWLERFRRFGAVQDGHFLLSSGLHSSMYVQSALILQYPQEAEALGTALAERVRRTQQDVVIAPALGGIVLAHEVARALGCRAIFAERADGVMQLRRGFAIAPGERTLVVEDVITTGGSVEDVAALVRTAGGEVVGFATLVDRSAGRAQLDAPLAALITLDLPVFSVETCPLCAQGVPARKPGSRTRSAVPAAESPTA
ncbi:MAG TPA: orotate phosphoribosyltransferase [bacterium]|nr:orotate phosphoribosyltransferase [bacterium]